MDLMEIYPGENEKCAEKLPHSENPQYYLGSTVANEVALVKC